MTNYETRFNAIDGELRPLVEDIAKKLGGFVSDHFGDDLGYVFGVPRSDGNTVFIKALMEASDDSRFPNAGNLVLRAETDDGELTSVLPGNLTDDVFADYSDADAWEIKIDALVRHSSTFVSIVSDWLEDVSPKP